jgi:hypothetical protein
LGGSGYYVLNAKKNADRSLDNAALQKSSSSSTNIADWVTYDSKDYGVKFDYPKELGSVSVKDSSRDGNKNYSFTFSDQDMGSATSVLMVSKNYERLGIGSVCSIGVGLANPKYSPADSDVSNWGIARKLISEDNLSVVERVAFPRSPGDSEDLDCPDGEIIANKRLQKSNEFEAATVFHVEKTPQNDRYKDQSSYETAYKSNSSVFIDDSTRQIVIRIARSLEVK